MRGSASLSLGCRGRSTFPLDDKWYGGKQRENVIPCGFPGFWESIPPPARGFGITQSTTDRAMESQTKAFLKMHGETGPVGAPCPLAVRMAGHGGCSSPLTAAALCPQPAVPAPAAASRPTCASGATPQPQPARRRCATATATSTPTARTPTRSAWPYGKGNPLSRGRQGEEGCV